MNKSINNAVVFLLMVSGILAVGCQSSNQKVDDAKAVVADAKKDLKEVMKDAKTEAIKVADQLQWKTFKEETEIKIKENETLIAGLRIKMKTKDKAKEVLYSNQIDLLEQKNKDLRERMNNYEKAQSDWESFKREFNHDMDELGKALKDFTVNNKK